MSNKYGIPADLYPEIQSTCALLGCVGDEQEYLLKTYQRLASWEDPLRPFILTNLLTIKRSDTFGQKICQHLLNIEEKEQSLIATINNRTDAIKVESQAVDESMKLANDEFSRKLAKLNGRFAQASKATIDTQQQLLQMHKQLKVRSRTTLQGKLQQYATALLIGTALGLYLPYSPVGEMFSVIATEKSL
ncbi:MAG: hypothetical protein WBM44_20375 [Waterburya sp.]